MDRELRALLVDGAAHLGVVLDDVAVGRFERYLTLLRLWGRSINLTSRLQPREIVLHHFLDSLAGARWTGGGEGGALLDVGTGAGFPGLPLKIAFPGIPAVLLDSVQKKLAFCRQVIRETGLTGIATEWGRAEERSADPALRGKSRWVVSRAVARSSELAALSLPFLAPDGSILLYKGRPERDELDDLARFCAAGGLEFEVNRVEIPGLDASRTILRVFRAAS